MYVCGRPCANFLKLVRASSLVNRCSYSQMYGAESGKVDIGVSSKTHLSDVILELKLLIL